MKKWKIILAATLAILTLVTTPLAIMAQGQAAADASKKNFPKVHLAIVQPFGVRVGQEIQLTVFSRLHQEPVEGAGVWVLPKENINSVKQAVKDMTVQNLANVTEANCENILNASGTFLYHTDAHGKIFYKVTEAGKYVLVALKPGYLPGYSPISVGNIMAINAPKRAAPGETVSIKVNQKDNSDPIVGAGLWMVESANIKTVREKIAQLKSTNRGNLRNLNWESELSGIAEKIGQTDESGQITNTFDSGKYLLVAVKQGFMPVLSVITILNP